MSNVVTLLLAAAALVAGLVFPPLSSYTAVYVVMGAMLIAAVLLRARLRDIARHPAYLAVAAAIVLLSLTLPFVWQGPDDLLVLGAIAPLPLGIGLVALFEAEPRFASPVLIGGLSLIGAFGAVLAGLNDIFVFGLDRAGSGNNPIHYADLSVALGLFAMIGVFGSKSRWRMIFLLGPLFALLAVLLSGSRGALLAYFATMAPLTGLLVVWFRREWLLGLSILAAGLVSVLLVTSMVFMPSLSNRAVDAFRDFGTAVFAFAENTGESAALSAEIDGSTDERLTLLRGAVAVFVEHPVFGVGAGQMISAAREHFPERHKQLGNHLHSDIGNFAASAGLFGLAGYFALLLAPFLRPSGNYGTDTRRVLLLGAMALSGSYFTLGLTNAVLGVLPQTGLHATLLACLVGIGRVWRADFTPTEPR
ncbi:MAG: O-antigen ligase family protein [Alphaproteobacteria bacterium]|nr:O-antigen ligase family protein [Alphaproteobacteria bacterium]